MWQIVLCVGGNQENGIYLMMMLTKKRPSKLSWNPIKRIFREVLWCRAYGIWNDNSKVGRPQKPEMTVLQKPPDYISSQNFSSHEFSFQECKWFILCSSNNLFSCLSNKFHQLMRLLKAITCLRSPRLSAFFAHRLTTATLQILSTTFIHRFTALFSIF